MKNKGREELKIAFYTYFGGNCEEALNYYLHTLGAEIIMSTKFEPYMTDKPDLVGKVFHSELKLGDFYFYLSDTDDSSLIQHKGFKITIECDSKDQMIEYFEKLSKDGVILNKITKMPWGMDYATIFL